MRASQQATTEAPAPAAEEVSAEEKPLDAADSAPEATDATDTVEESESTDDAPYGEGSHAPLDDPDATPAGFEIKGNADSMLYHVPGSAFYDRTVPEVWFASEEAAEAAGFSKPASQRSDDEDAGSEES